MDHLPYPSDAYYAPVQIPFVIRPDTTRYDGLGLPGFASRCGWQTTEDDWFEREPHLAAERAQSWLYFGLLREVFGHVVQESDFVRIDVVGARWIDTAAKLPVLLKTWSGSRTRRKFSWVWKNAVWRLVVLGSAGLAVALLFLRSPRLDRHMKDGRNLHPRHLAALQEAEIQVRRLEDHHGDSDHVGVVSLSIRALIWSIRNAAVNHNPDLMKKHHLPLSSSRYLERTLQGRGFCLRELAYIKDRCSVAVLHYISAYAYDTAAHQNCSLDRCVAFNVDQDQYTTQHTDSCRGCHSARVDFDKLKGIVESGQTPIICAHASQEGVRLEVRPVTYSTSYLAISHAWSGGLGNTLATSLPSCQIERIVAILRPLSPSLPPSKSNINLLHLITGARQKTATPAADREGQLLCTFWMDTLCIPTRQEAADRLRHKALANMNRIYAEAAYVVVLDSAFRGENMALGSGVRIEHLHLTVDDPMLDVPRGEASTESAHCLEWNTQGSISAFRPCGQFS